MAKKDPRVDAYLAKAPDFARPILLHVRKAVHAAVPKAEETIKWGVPFFTYHGILCHVAAFKAHCMFFVWNKALPSKLKDAGLSDKTPHKLRRIISLDELPDAATLKRLLKLAAALNEAGEKGPPRARAKPKKKLAVPADLKAALSKNKRARATFEGFTPAKQREYIEWITDAKRDETRQARLKTAVGWMAEGKSRNWKYL